MEPVQFGWCAHRFTTSFAWNTKTWCTRNSHGSLALPAVPAQVATIFTSLQILFAPQIRFLKGVDFDMKRIESCFGSKVWVDLGQHPCFLGQRPTRSACLGGFLKRHLMAALWHWNLLDDPSW